MCTGSVVATFVVFPLVVVVVASRHPHHPGVMQVEVVMVAVEVVMVDDDEVV